ncbi:alpha-galactosidase [Agreia sp. VKM Ac-1783]|uniref:alpha-galactosidase n=1 Tax=Agreia sp. VKM Ac-1783 TaxID=1938889 RepID=UPI000A2ACAB1|nr:alpha-galactosidase [Agreia sp. VKM Ac-1783]SMQ68193.1 alpha-galactosidase [Agreia sp. VKM Ac-1783]
MQSRNEYFHLRSAGTSVVIDLTALGFPAIVHWGEDLGELTEAQLEDLGIAGRPQRVSGGLDTPSRLTLVPLESAGWHNEPGLVGSRHGRDFSPTFVLTETHSDAPDGGPTTSVRLRSVDEHAQLDIQSTLTLDGAGLLHQQHTLTNLGDTDYEVQHLLATFPVPQSARELLDTTGRHLRERSPQRHGFTTGRHVRDSRRGRPGADSTLFLAAGTPGFGFERGLVHAVHLAWSGNQRVAAERTVASHALVQAGELLAPGELCLGPGESYTTPDALGSWGDGLTAVSARFHDSVRARPSHPSTSRPVTLNTWEAVYFDHDLDRLTRLADAGARVGAERFVLDDGWFRGRRDDTAGLGDWFVDDDIWPRGLTPIVEHVAALGMQFGLWVEPEMVNPDSELARAHPDWILQTGDHLPLEGRQQQVLDLSNGAVFDYLLERLDALLGAYDIAYLKWDHNRDLLEAGSTVTGKAAVHSNVRALYRLLDELKSRHPALEIESCASGGARVDLGILDHTDRIWTSDCIDPIERLTIQKYTNVVVPYELMGAHIGGPRSHSTGRRHELALRAGAALPGHFGIEWDISRLDDAELNELAAWVDAHKRVRELAHTGRAVYADLPDETADLRGVVSRDRDRALYAYTQVTSSASYPPGPITFPGLDDDQVYGVSLASPTTPLDGAGQSSLAWTEHPVHLTGRSLRTVGIQAPVLFPEQLRLIDISAI